MSRAWYEIQMEKREMDRRLDEIAHKKTQEILKERRPSYCMHTPPEVLQRLGQRHRESSPTNEMRNLCQTMNVVAQKGHLEEKKTECTTTRKQDFFKEYGIEETIVPGRDRR